ncbi:MAG: hypothetical protein H0T79_05785 [Deltaproteobacteria bacterium]|nr:hypothetical protein [Deltaproteobacteria bacterium]
MVVPPATDRTKFLLRRFYPQASDTDPDHPKVAVATGYAPSGGLTLQELDGLSAGDAKAIVATATTNLGKGPRAWQVSEKAGFIFKKPSLLRGMGDMSGPVTTMSTEGGGIDDLASDLILDEGFMARAGDELGATELIAAIPKRGWLLVGKCTPGQLPVMMKFTQIAEGIAGRGGRDALTTNCYFVSLGKVKGVSGKGYLSLLTSHDNPWNRG